MPTTREYEITYTLDSRLEEVQRDELNAAIDRTISEQQGSISTNSDTTRRKLAYPIKKQRMGFLRAIQAQLPPEAVQPLRHAIVRLDGVLRLTIIQSPPRPDVTSAIFDTIKQQAEPKAAAAAAKKAAPALTTEEVEAKIEEALDEEVK